MFAVDELGRTSKLRRRELAFTQAELARKAGVSRIQVDRFENGRLSDIGYRGLMRILNALGLDLRLSELNVNRPTLDDLRAENDR